MQLFVRDSCTQSLHILHFLAYINTPTLCFFDQLSHILSYHILILSPPPLPLSLNMTTRRYSAWGRGGLYVRGRKKAKVCFGKKENNVMRASYPLQRKLKQLQRTVPGSHGMDAQALFLSIQNYIVLLEAKVRILRSLTSFYGV